MKPKKLSQTWTMYGIANQYGEPWTPHTFDTEHQAREYLDRAEIKSQQHKVVTVRTTVRIIKQQ